MLVINFLEGVRGFPLKKNDADAASQQASWSLTLYRRGMKIRYDPFLVFLMIPYSAAGKILRRQLRDRAKSELEGRDPGEVIKGKL